MHTPKTIAIVGATNAVGSEIIKILDERVFPVQEIVPISSGSSGANHIDLHGESVAVRKLGKDCFQGVDIAFFCAGAAISEEYGPVALEHGCIVIDDSGYFSLQSHVPLVIPEINAHRIKEHTGIIANPCAASIQLALVLSAIQRQAKIQRVVVSTYQAVSSDGQQAVKELSDQIQALFNFREPTVQVFPSQIAFNCLPVIGSIQENGYSEQEQCLALETRKILENDELLITATAVRVPIFYGHCETLHIETSQKLTAEQARNILSHAAGISVEDDPQNNMYPLPLFAVGRDEIFVGRIREDWTVPNGLVMWVVGDNLRKGAALNAVQIAELLLL